MRVLFLARLDFEEPTHLGVKNKILGQLSAMKNLGLKPDLLNWSSSNLEFNHQKTTLIKQSKLDFYSLFFSYAKELCRNCNYDIIWLRYPWFDPYSVGFLKYMKKMSFQATVLLEIPTYPFGRELSSTTEIIRFGLDKYYSKKIAPYLTAIVTYSQHERIYGVNTIHINNGHNFSELPEPCSFEGDALNLIAVGNISYWHGYDRVLNGFKRHSNLVRDRKVNFHLIGAGPELKNLRSQVDIEQIENIRFHGPRYGDDFSRLISSLGGIGIGSLGAHRKGIFYESALKTREYIKHGLPLVHATYDRDIEDFKYKYRVAQDDTLLNVEDVIKWYDSLNLNISKSREIQEFGRGHLSWENQFRKVFDKLQLNYGTN